MNKPSRGFTIVELLVVIVVIAILASITVVAYTGSINSSGVYIAFITYNIMGDQSCGRATKTVSTAYGPQMTECRLDITP